MRTLFKTTGSTVVVCRIHHCSCVRCRTHLSYAPSKGTNIPYKILALVVLGGGRSRYLGLLACPILRFDHQESPSSH